MHEAHHFVHEHDVGAGAGEDAEDLAVLPPELAQPPDELLLGRWGRGGGWAWWLVWLGV